MRSDEDGNLRAGSGSRRGNHRRADAGIGAASEAHGASQQAGYTTASDFDQCDGRLFPTDIREESIYALLDSWPGWYSTCVTFSIELEREDDGRWLAEVPTLAGVMCYGADRDEAVARVQALALRVIAERLEHREAPAEFLNVTFQAA